jgi:hypothetical protein
VSLQNIYISPNISRETALPCPGLRVHCVTEKSGHNSVVSLQNIYISPNISRETALPCPGLRVHCVTEKSGHNSVVSLQNIYISTNISRETAPPSPDFCFGLIEPNLISVDPKTVSSTWHQQGSKLCQLRESRRC